jgi:hypothetical protein
MRPTLAVAAALLATAPSAQRQERAGDTDAQPASLPGTERREPWLLRPAPPPMLEQAGCPPDAHYLFRIGGLALRLEPGVGWAADPVERRPPTWRSDLPRCGDGRAIGVTRLCLYIQSVSGLPPGCLPAGEPPGSGGPACADTPEGLRAGRGFFALGLPYDVSIRERPAPVAATDGEDARLRGLTIRRWTPLGNEDLRAPVPSRPDLDGGPPTYRLPRTGEGAGALGPLLVECDTARWPDPVSPGRPRSLHFCAVLFDAPRAGVRVIYSFPREVNDEPDWQALDLRVRGWIAARTVPEAPR